MRRFATFIAASFLATAASSAAPAGDWQHLTGSETGMQPGDNPMVAIWNDVMTAEADQIRAGGSTLYVKGKEVELPQGQFAPETFAHAELRDGDKTYTVSFMLQRSCDNGANSAFSDITPSRCPVRVTETDGGQSKTMQVADNACTLWPTIEDTDPAQNYTRAKIDGQTLTVETYVHGKIVPDCTTTAELK